MYRVVTRCTGRQGEATVVVSYIHIVLLSEHCVFVTSGKEDTTGILIVVSDDQHMISTHI